ncbi:RING finger protein 17 isoform X2 [Gouania willdenowi]|uniref:RING finger protein 17 isoform X2 n=1 Tax=Gouania willdenowi TaxID=441366 RepID=UPI00105479BA|nr:RING finger protein 17 isoform X2 [Gouania willdenowi]
MDQSDHPHSIVCILCGDVFTLPEDGVEDNLPRFLLCGHIYCTVCLQSIECDNVIKCPECEVVSTLSERGVFGLQEDSRIIGLIYTTKINRMKGPVKSSKHRQRNQIPRDVPAQNTKELVDMEKNERKVDEALIVAAENLAQLECINETLTSMSKQEKKVEFEIEKASAKAILAVQKWKRVQLSKVMESFVTSYAAQCKVQERMKAVKLAIQMAREVCRVPFLKQYCTLDEVLDILQAPVEDQFIDMKCITVGPKMSCVFISKHLDQSLTLSLEMKVHTHKDSSPLINRKLDNFNEKLFSEPSCNALPNSQKVAEQNPEPNLIASPPIILPQRKISLSHQSTLPPSASLDVIVEEIIEEGQDNAGPELCKNGQQGDKGGRYLQPDKIKLNRWVMVTHIVNPSHFYIQYVTEDGKRKILSKKTQYICSKESYRFTSSDTVETGSLVFAQYEDGLWSRARVVKILQSGQSEEVNTCHITDLDTLHVFFQDYGPMKIITIKSKEEGIITSKLKAINCELRKVDQAADMELGYFAPQATRCSLKDLVPYDLTKGWTEEARTEFYNVVCHAVVEMHLMGQNRNALLVDLKRTPMDQSSDEAIYLRDYLVLMGVARFYSPVALAKSWSYDPPILPEINTMHDALVTHVNSPSDFYIQLVKDPAFLLFSAKLQECYSATSELRVDELTINAPVIHGACVTCFDGNLWYRAQVIDLLSEGEVEVLFVDFGNKKVLPVFDLRAIKEEFFTHPSMAIHCCMSDIIPLDGETWSDTCTSRFISLSHQKLVSVIATEETDPLSVKMFKCDVDKPKTSIADLLVKESLACFKEGIMTTTGCDNSAVWDPAVDSLASSKEGIMTTTGCDNSTVWDPPLDSLASSKEGIMTTTGCDDSPIWDPPLDLKACLDEQDGFLLELKPLLNTLSQQKNLNVRVTHVNSPSSFYVQFTQFDSHLKRICDLVKECALTDSQNVEWKADMFCAAKVAGVWERGQLCSDVQGSCNEVEVRRCDHGNTVKVHIGNLRPLPSSLIGCMALECFLHDIRPAGGRTTWTDTACDLFSHYLTQAMAVLTFKELTEKPPVPVTLFYFNTVGHLISMSDFLMSEGLALREWKPRDALIPHPIKTAASSAESDHLPVEKKSNPFPSESLVTFPTVPKLTPPVFRHIPPKPAPRFQMCTKMVKTSLYDPPDLPSISQILIKVSSVGDDGTIYVRTRTAERQLKHLQQRIEKSMKTLPRHQQYTWKSVQGCAVFGSDMLWYRGQLLEVLGGHVKVQYVDYGLVENIPFVHVYPVLLCDDVPQLSLPCQLRDINPVGGMWQKDALDLMKEMLVDRSLEMLVKELPSDPRGPLMVEMFIDGLSLTGILCHHQHGVIDGALTPGEGEEQILGSPILDEWVITTEGLIELEDPMMESFVNPILPHVGESFKVRVTHLCTPNELFMCPLEGTAHVKVHAKNLEGALTRINSDIKSLPHPASFFRGAPCLAEYGDGKYYRARLMDITSVEPAKLLIQHVDFGSDETLPTKQLRQIPTELLQFPCQALKVRVAGFKAPSVSLEEDMLPYSPEWSIKAMVEMLNLLHNNITATVVALEPQLTVLLCDEKGEFIHSPLVHMGLAELE